MKERPDKDHEPAPRGDMHEGPPLAGSGEGNHHSGKTDEERGSKGGEEAVPARRWRQEERRSEVCHDHERDDEAPEDVDGDVAKRAGLCNCFRWRGFYTTPEWFRWKKIAGFTRAGETLRPGLESIPRRDPRSPGKAYIPPGRLREERSGGYHGNH